MKISLIITYVLTVLCGALFSLRASVVEFKLFFSAVSVPHPPNLSTKEEGVATSIYLISIHFDTHNTHTMRTHLSYPFPLTTFSNPLPPTHLLPSFPPQTP